jgi:hypothetical protein
VKAEGSKKRDEKLKLKIGKKSLKVGICRN